MFHATRLVSCDNVGVDGEFTRGKLLFWILRYGYTGLVTASESVRRKVVTHEAGTFCKGSLRTVQAGSWSGRWESNPRPKLGKLLYCHCTTPALLSSVVIIHNKATARTDWTHFSLVDS